MRTIIVAATLVAGVLVMASCQWFLPSKGHPVNLIGAWKIDSVHPGSDSSKALFLALLMMKDTIKPSIVFNKDSSYVNLPDSSKGKYYVKDKQLFIAEDSTYVPYNLLIVGDSTIHLLANDSALYVLKR